MDYSRYGEDGVRVLFGNTIDLESTMAVNTGLIWSLFAPILG